MSVKPQKSSLSEKLKKAKANRSAILTAIVLIIALAVIIAVSVSSNRTKKDDLPKQDTPSQTTTKAPSTTQPSTTLPATTSSPGVNLGKPGEGGIEFDYSDFFQ